MKRKKKKPLQAAYYNDKRMKKAAKLSIPTP
jgi:hypothetical protein